MKYSFLLNSGKVPLMNISINSLSSGLFLIKISLFLHRVRYSIKGSSLFCTVVSNSLNPTFIAALNEKWSKNALDNSSQLDFLLLSREWYQIRVGPCKEVENQSNIN